MRLRKIAPAIVKSPSKAVTPFRCSSKAHRAGGLGSRAGRREPRFEVNATDAAPHVEEAAVELAVRGWSAAEDLLAHAGDAFAFAAPASVEAGPVELPATLETSAAAFGERTADLLDAVEPAVIGMVPGFPATLPDGWDFV